MQSLQHRNLSLSTKNVTPKMALQNMESGMGVSWYSFSFLYLPPQNERPKCFYSRSKLDCVDAKTFIPRKEKT